MRRLTVSCGIVGIVALGGCSANWSLDGVSGVVFGIVLNEDTVYAGGYSDWAFLAIQPGMTPQQVRRLIGAPIGENWILTEENRASCFNVYFENDRVVYGCEALGIPEGMTITVVASRLKPHEVVWRYSKSPGDTHYKMRIVEFADGLVTKVVSGWYLD